MSEIPDGETAEVKGSARDPYILKNTGGIYSCSCPAWRNQSVAIEKRTCKHLRQYLGEEFEKARLGGEIPARSAAPRPRPQSSASADDTAEPAEDSGPGILLAHSWDGSEDLTGWWMSEKLDGVRAYWDGKKFISRQGNEYLAPAWFVEDLPTDVHLDGELWLGRKAFQRTVSIVRRQDRNDEWKQITYVVFDAPLIDDMFEARIAYIQQTLDELRSRWAQPHLHVRCKGTDHLREELARVEALGGEGLMLRKPGSKYEVGRSYTLLKVKTFHDSEAKVIEHLPGTGRHKGRMGALSVELADGTRFSVGTGFSDAERENPPPVGSIITFRYQELSDRGVPRFPSFVRLRTDVDTLTQSFLPGTGGAVFTAGPNGAPPITTAHLSSAQAGSGTTTENPQSARTPKVQSTPDSSEPSKKTATTSSGDWRYFEFVEGNSSKFWKVTVTGNDVTVQFGRIGSQGQEKTKSFSTESAAKNYAAELIEEKTKKGYEEKAAR
jgi:DNA ligase 1